MTKATSLPARESWVSALAAADPARVAAIAADIQARAEIELVAPSREGAMLLQLRDSVAGAAFHLGEIPVASAEVRLVEGERVAHGGAVLLSDDRARVVQLAILDAALAADWPDADEIGALIADGLARRFETERARAHILDATRVDFQLLSEAPDSDA
jgi:alpha-D-ribose 1-methylphosphonate 5-triphosphate synthase subunit PhnG